MKEALNLTAMIDMMTILLIFLLVQYAAMSFSETDAQLDKLPTVSSAGDVSSETHIILRANGLTDKDGNPFDLESLKGKEKVSLQIDRSLKMREVLAVKDKLNLRGITHIEMAVIEMK